MNLSAVGSRLACYCPKYANRQQIVAFSFDNHPCHSEISNNYPVALSLGYFHLNYCLFCFTLCCQLSCPCIAKVCLNAAPVPVLVNCYGVVLVPLARMLDSVRLCGGSVLCYLDSLGGRQVSQRKLGWWWLNSHTDMELATL